MNPNLRNKIVKELSDNTLVEETVVRAIISHQFASAIEAFKIYKSIELSGLCKFLFNDKKATKKMAKLVSQKELFEAYSQREDISEKQRHNYTLKLETVNNNINTLKPKL